MISRRDVLSAGRLVGLIGATGQDHASSARPGKCFSLWRTRVAPGRNYASGVTRALDAELGFIDVPAGTVTEHADLVVIDHRGGLGCAYPKLPALPVRELMPFGRRVGLDEREEHYRRFFQKQIDYWGEAGVDLRHMRTPQLARDIEMIRLSLGYDKIRLSGLSNGTYRIREYLRQFHHRVDSALLFISHGYQKLPLQEFISAALSRIDAAVSADPDANRFVPSLSSSSIITISLCTSGTCSATATISGRRRQSSGPCIRRAITVIWRGWPGRPAIWEVREPNPTSRRLPVRPCQALPRSRRTAVRRRTRYISTAKAKEARVHARGR